MKPTLITTALCLTLSVGIAGLACAAPPESSCGSKPLSVDCGGARATIACIPRACSTEVSLDDLDSSSCERTTLRLERADGHVIKLTRPKEMVSYPAWPVGLACTKAKDGTPYLAVNYGQPPLGCVMCEWLYLYTTQGQILTHSDPPILTDHTRPNHHGDPRSPNNEEFGTLAKKLNLGKLDFKYFE